MNVHDDLDIRLRSAGESLHRSVELLPADAPPAPGPNHRPLLAAAAAVLVVVAIAAAALALRAYDDADVSTDPDGIPRLVLGDPPEGLPATGAVDLPLAAGEDDDMFPPAAVAIYETTLPDDPATVAGLMVMTLSRGDGVELTDGETVTVRGKPGSVTEDELLGLSVGWEEEPGVLVVVGTRDQVGRDALLAVAADGTFAGGTFSPGPVAAGSEPPDLVGSIDDFDMWSGSPISRSAVGHMVGYQSDDDIGRLVSVTSFASTDGDIAVVRWVAGATEPTEVRGHDAWLGSQTFETSSSGSGSSDGSSDGGSEEQVTSDTMRTLVWEEAPDVYVVLRASGVTEDELLDLAEDLRPAGAAEWTSLLTDTDSATPTGVPDAIEGRFGETAWSVYIGEDGSLCAATAGGSTGVENCGSSTGPTVLTDEETGTPLVVYGVLPDGAVGIDLEGTGIGYSVRPAAGGRQIYAVDLDGVPAPTVLTFLDDAGQVVEQAQVGVEEVVPATTDTTIRGDAAPG